MDDDPILVESDTGPIRKDEFARAGVEVPIPIAGGIGGLGQGQKQTRRGSPRVVNGGKNPALAVRIEEHSRIEDIGFAQARPETVQRHGADGTTRTVLNAYLAVECYHQMIWADRPLAVGVERRAVIPEGQKTRRRGR